MKQSSRPWPRMGATVFRDMIRRAERAVTFDELRALRRFARRRLNGDERLPQLDEAIEQRAMALIANAEQAARDAGEQR